MTLLGLFLMLIAAGMSVVMKGDSLINLLLDDPNSRIARIDSEFKTTTYTMTACVIGVMVFGVFKAMAEEPSERIYRAEPQSISIAQHNSTHSAHKPHAHAHSHARTVKK